MKVIVSEHFLWYLGVWLTQGDQAVGSKASRHDEEGFFLECL
jgi:hypothetical protein